jgi:hypothetical protein
MKPIRVLLLLSFVCIFSFITIQPVAAQTLALTPPCTPNMNTIPSCPATGCGDLGDALLNQAKNRFDSVTNPTPVTLAQIQGINQPSTWDTGRPRTPLASIEGRPVVVMAFLLKAKREGKESCNCGITGPLQYQYSFGLGFTATR